MVAVAALVQRPLTSLMATRKSGVRSVRDLRGKRVGTAGIPYQSAYLKTILARANVPASSREGDERRRQPAARDAVRARSTRRWARSGTSRASSCASAGSEPWIAARRPARRPGLRRAGAGRQRGRASRTSATTCACSSRRVARGARAGPQRPAAARPGACSTPTTDLQAAARRARACGSRSRRCFPSSATSRSGYLDPVQWRNYGGWMVDNGLLEGAARRRRGAHERAAAGRRARSSAAAVYRAQQVHVDEERARSDDRAAQLTPAAAPDPRPSAAADARARGRPPRRRP